ncbi:hypothetical protein QUB63_04165 [Microcoleus sp. ARI1-B5]|uniref:hypothetical protein n=1 Tax=unclassified Microcoleus TaxID=2642155 RepID=UPI002FD1BD60
MDFTEVRPDILVEKPGCSAIVESGARGELKGVRSNSQFREGNFSVDFYAS